MVTMCDGQCTDEHAQPDRQAGAAKVSLAVDPERMIPVHISDHVQVIWNGSFACRMLHFGQ